MNISADEVCGNKRKVVVRRGCEWWNEAVERKRRRVILEIFTGINGMACELYKRKRQVRDGEAEFCRKQEDVLEKRKV